MLFEFTPGAPGGLTPGLPGAPAGLLLELVGFTFGTLGHLLLGTLGVYSWDSWTPNAFLFLGLLGVYSWGSRGFTLGTPGVCSWDSWIFTPGAPWEFALGIPGGAETLGGLLLEFPWVYSWRSWWFTFGSAEFSAGTVGHLLVVPWRVYPLDFWTPSV